MKIIPYYRVSTQKQGRSGLGLEAQKADVEAFVRQRDAKIIAEYKEIETGKKADRPTLAEAIGHAKLAKATLVVAKLDRLARNVAFTSALMESGVDFVACDNPHANRLTIHILAAVAEDEALRISRRTKDALAAAKARGIKLGSARPAVGTEKNIFEAGRTPPRPQPKPARNGLRTPTHSYFRKCRNCGTKAARVSRSPNG